MDLPSVKHLRNALLIKAYGPPLGHVILVRFFMSSFVYIPEKDEFFIEIWDSKTEKFEYGKAKMNKKKTYTKYAKQTTKAEFEKAKSDENNLLLWEYL